MDTEDAEEIQEDTIHPVQWVGLVIFLGISIVVCMASVVIASHK